MMLEVDNISASYGKIAALTNFSLSVNEGEIVTLIGANGAGKTTALKTISGLLRTQAGRMVFSGADITRTPPHKILKLGISMAPEGRRVFPRLSVAENLEMGAFTRTPAETRSGMEKAFSLFPILAERRGQQAGTLSGGEQQMLAIGRALMSNPKLLLLDEPSLGLAPKMVETIFGIISNINLDRTAILLVEQNANMALATAVRGYVLESGRIVLEDNAPALMKNEQVRRSYLGENG